MNLDTTDHIILLVIKATYPQDAKVVLITVSPLVNRAAKRLTSFLTMSLFKHILIISLSTIALFFVSTSSAYAGGYYYGNGGYYAPQYQQYSGYYNTSAYSPVYSYYISQPAIYYAVNNPTITYPTTNYQGGYNGYGNYNTGYYRQPSTVSCIIGAILTRNGCGGGSINSYYGYGGYYYPTQIY